MTKDIRLIALDLDGTLLTTDKHLTERNLAALRRASEQAAADAADAAVVVAE